MNIHTEEEPSLTELCKSRHYPSRRSHSFSVKLLPTKG